jgi:O-Antigen ligase
VVALSDRDRAAALVLAILTGLFAWWALKQGAYFGSVFYPGALGVYALLFLLLIFTPPGGRLDPAIAVALAALVALAAWMLLTLIWTPTPRGAIADAQRVFLYASVFAAGIWARRLVARETLALLAPIAVAGAVVGAVTVATLAFGSDVASYLHEDGTLRFPIGYRNANAAFFLLCAWPLLSAATSNRTAWALRGLSIGGATMLIELGVLAQSRGSLPATCVALLVFLGFSAHRLRAAGILLLAVLPVLPALPTLFDVFQHGRADSIALGLLRDSSAVIAISSVASVVLGAVVLRFLYPRLNLGPRRVRILGRSCALIAMVAVALGTGAFLAQHGGPVKFVDQRVKELKRVGYPNLSHQTTRFGVDIGSNRGDFWRVALHEGLDHPLLGGGAGSFELAYQKNRKSTENPKDPHSSEMLMFSEFGLPGLLLFATFLVAATIAAVRHRRAGPLAATVVAGGLAAAAQWFVHSSYDWLWFYPGVTAPAIYLLGVMSAPSLERLDVRWPRRIRLATLVGLVVLGLLAVPLFLSEQFTHRALGEAETDPHGAYANLDRASALNPFDSDPLIDKGTIAGLTGDRTLALSSFREAHRLEPESYLPYYLSARELRLAAPAVAKRDVAMAHELNPLDPEVLALRRRLVGPSARR